MTTAVKTGLIIALALATTGSDNAAGNKTISGKKMSEQVKTATISGQNNNSSTEETNDHYLFPLTKTFLNEL